MVAGQISLLSSGSVNDEHHGQVSDQDYDEALVACPTLDHKYRAACEICALLSR